MNGLSTVLCCIMLTFQFVEARASSVLNAPASLRTVAPYTADVALLDACSDHRLRFYSAFALCNVRAELIDLPADLRADLLASSGGFVSQDPCDITKYSLGDVEPDLIVAREMQIAMTADQWNSAVNILQAKLDVYVIDVLTTARKRKNDRQITALNDFWTELQQWSIADGPQQWMSRIQARHLNLSGALFGPGAGSYDLMYLMGVDVFSVENERALDHLRNAVVSTSSGRQIDPPHRIRFRPSIDLDELKKNVALECKAIADGGPH